MKTNINKVNVVIGQGKINNVYYPHFVAYFKDGFAKFALDMKMTEGKLPPNVTHEIMDWAKQNYDVLQSKWNFVMRNTHINQLN